MKEKAKKFYKELIELCKKHKICLSTSDYDGMQIWDLENDETEEWEIVYCNGIEDKTKEKP